MRKLRPKYGDTRVVAEFQWFPRTLKDRAENEVTRWLEHATILQKHVSTRHGRHWRDVRWEDLPERD